MVIRAGELRDELVIQQGTNTNIAGKTKTTWSTFASPRGLVMPQRGSEYFAARQILDKDPIKIQIRYVSGITTEMRLLHNYKIHDIVSPPIDTRNRHREMILYVTQANDPITEYYSYLNLSAADDGTSTGKAVITWLTDFYSDTQVFYRKVLTVPWTDSPVNPKDTSPRVFSHSHTIGPLEFDNDFEVRVRGYNDNGRYSKYYTGGYSAIITINVDADGKVTMGGS